MVDSADLGFYGAAWRFADFCQQLFARSVYLQFVLKCRRTPRLHSSANNHRESHIEFRSPGSVSDERPRLLCSRLALSRRFPPGIAAFSAAARRWSAVATLNAVAVAP